MAQGKLKVKAKLPQNMKTKTRKSKGRAITKRANCPVKSRKKFDESHKLKQVLTKAVNKAVEDEIRAKATPAQKQLSKAQQTVAEHSKREGSSTSSSCT